MANNKDFFRNFIIYGQNPILFSGLTNNFENSRLNNSRFHKKIIEQTEQKLFIHFSWETTMVLIFRTKNGILSLMVSVFQTEFSFKAFMPHCSLYYIYNNAENKLWPGVKRKRSGCQIKQKKSKIIFLFRVSFQQMYKCVYSLVSLGFAHDWIPVRFVYFVLTFT